MSSRGTWSLRKATCYVSSMRRAEAGMRDDASEDECMVRKGQSGRAVELT